MNARGQTIHRSCRSFGLGAGNARVGDKIFSGSLKISFAVFVTFRRKPGTSSANHAPAADTRLPEHTQKPLIVYIYMFSLRLASLSFSRRLCTAAVVAAMLFTASAKSARAATENPALLDTFSDPRLNNFSAPRILVTDKEIGGRSQATQSYHDGILAMHGELEPARGQPAFISLVSPLSTDGLPHDLSKYERVRLRVKVIKGMLSVQVSSADIQNYDYHTSAPITRRPGEFSEVKVPFATMKRAWSEQVPLNLKAITSINLVAAGMAKDSFAYEIDEIGFY